MLNFKEFILESFGVVHKGDFIVSDYMITDGKFNKPLPHIVNGRFHCVHAGLTSLEGCPKIIHGTFDCSNNELTSLEGGPDIVEKIFRITNNKLKNLKYSPEYIGEDLICHYNDLTSLEGAPLKIGGNIYIQNNKFDLNIEKTFVLKKKYFDKNTYWIDLLKYMIDENIELDKVFGWPKDFLESNAAKSIIGISKFNL